MIARRLRPIGWVAGVAAAALSFYLVSLQVASERTELESVQRRIVIAERDIRHLETEFSARASLRQLEAYNNEVLALAAPKVDQYLNSEVQLASYVPGTDGVLAKQAPQTALASAQTGATVAPAGRPVLRQAVVADARSDGAPVIPAVKRPVLIQAVAMIEDLPAPRQITAPKPKVKPAGPQRVAMLDGNALGEIARKAAKEAKTKQ
jgi:DNA polymerase III psi subunit